MLRLPCLRSVLRHLSADDAGSPLSRAYLYGGDPVAVLDWSDATDPAGVVYELEVSSSPQFASGSSAVSQHLSQILTLLCLPL